MCLCYCRMVDIEVQTQSQVIQADSEGEADPTYSPSYLSVKSAQLPLMVAFHFVYRNLPTLNALLIFTCSENRTCLIFCF